MPLYLVAIHRPNDYDPATAEDDAMRAEIDALNDDMVAAGVRKFVCGLQPISTTKSIVAQPDGQAEITNGLYLQSGEHVGGFWVLEVASEEEATEWGRKASIACRAPVEIRPLH